MTNEQLALLLDPEHKRVDLWHYGQTCMKCNQDYFSCPCEQSDSYFGYRYTGPDYHASDDACFRDWRPVLLAAGCKIKDSSFHGVEVYLCDAWIGMMGRWTKHTYRVAVLAAIEELQTTKPELLRKAIARVEGGE